MSIITLKNGKKLEMRNLGKDDFYSFQKFSDSLASETTFTNQYPGQPPKNSEKLTEQWKSESVISIGLFDDKRQVGNIFASIEKPDNIRCKYTASFGMGILKEIEGQGAGSILIKELIKWAMEKKLKRIEGSVRTKNFKAISLYLQHGFEIEGCRRCSAIIGNECYDEYVIGKLL